MSLNRLTLLLCAVLVVLLVFFVETIPPQSMTGNSMHMMKRRILRFAAHHNTLPTSIDQFPHFEGYHNGVKDGWGKPILWKVDGNTVVLTSYGRDGVPGGSGEDADMVGVFLTKTANGEWSEELCKWERDPFRN